MKKTHCALLLLSFLSLIYSTNCSSDYEEVEEEINMSNEHGVTELMYKTNCTCGRTNKQNTKIVGGVKTLPNEYPLMAGLHYRKNGQINCGGTILTTRHVLTAAHCIARFKTNDIRIFIGHYSYREVRYTTILRVIQRFIVHPKYDYFSTTYDIGIVLLKYPITFNNDIEPACLPKDTSGILTGKYVLAMGWGRIKHKGELSDYLLKVYLKILEKTECYPVNNRFEKEDVHQLCLDGKKKDSCNGDSGGPLLWLDPQTNRYTLIGVISYGSNCAVNSSVASDINYFLPWIQYVISSSDNSSKTCAKI